MDHIKPEQFRSARVAGADGQNDIKFNSQGGTRIPQPIGWNFRLGRKQSKLQRRKSSPAIARRTVHLQVLIVWLGKMQLNSVVRESAIVTVRNELTRVDHKLKLVSAASLGTIKAQTIGPEIFVVYARQRWSDGQSLETARKHDSEYTSSDIEGMWETNAAASANILEARGVNIRRGTAKKSLSFVELEYFETKLKHYLPAVPPSMRTQTMKDTGKDLGELILHELGHAMNADHPDGGLMQAVTYKDATVGALHFSDLSIQKMRAFLASL